MVAQAARPHKVPTQQAAIIRGKGPLLMHPQNWRLTDDKVQMISYKLKSVASTSHQPSAARCTFLSVARWTASWFLVDGVAEHV
jgi:hypothetical protein